MEHQTNFTFIHPQRLTLDSISKQNIFLLVKPYKTNPLHSQWVLISLFSLFIDTKKEIKLKLLVISFTLSSTSIKHWWKDQKPSIKLLKLYVLLVYCFFDPVFFLFRLRVLCHNWIFSFVIINYCTDALNVTVMFFFSFFVIFPNEKFSVFFSLQIGFVIIR